MAEFEELKVEAPSLSFGAFDEAPAAEAAAPEPAKEEKEVSADEAKRLAEQAKLTEEELAQVKEFVTKIDLNNSAAIMNYGTGTQKKMADFSEKTLQNVRTKDLGEVGEMISDLVGQLKQFEDEDQPKGLFGLFKKSGDRLASMKNKFSLIETNVGDIANELENHQVQLMKDVAILDQMYDVNLGYFKELTMYILAGKQKLEEVRSKDLKELQEKALRTGLAEDAQAAKDLAAQCDRFEKKIYDLEVTRTVAMQTAPQIRMIQSSNSMMAEKIQSTIVNTIPLWKNQMVIAIGLEHATKAEEAQREVTNMTNELLRKNAEQLKTATIESAKESERAIVDLETVKHTNELLISTMDEVLQIQKDGKQKRHEAEVELAQIEAQLKAKLLEASRS